ncbi:penicillin-binding protein 2A [Cytobacillus eiseniae]|uniref:Penicillin-binding protein 2A n=1 Tax=Cytobacillus eiseniae TaxID=762947 RepID=A0ABS4RD59_9BACI|nr:PBP1A family penicillin-binding protein [Cytobacillus eiseniae]MBP2239792.1 penicillin-binding protein 2A [Cytobacillus eiseniae]
MEQLKKIWEAIRRFWRKRHLTKILLLILLTLLLFTILFFAFIAATANVETLKDGLKQSTVIYDKNEDVASNLATNRSEGIQIEELPDYVKNAIVAIEDERFYDHNGFDIKGIARAFFKNIFAGRITGGGSTITQQLTKNALLSSEKTYRRKIEELFLAVEIEKNYKKDEILQMYMNQVYFGSGAWGIGQAANKYFNKNAKDLTISESAMLAGLLQSPSARDPFKHYDRALERRNVVLGKMKEHNMISESEYEQAIADKIQLNEGSGSYIERSYPYYVDAVLDEAINQYGLTQEEIFTRGYRIYTELDQNLQESLEKVYEKDSLFPKGKNGMLVQSGAVLLNPQSGGVRALVGGRGDYVFRGFNRATHIKAQPGSTLKPLAVYTPALEEGYDESSILKDEPIVFDNYSPENATKEYSGNVTMYKAIEESLNIPAVWLLDQIGLEKGLDALNRFGIPLEDEDEYLGIALGGMHKGISPMKLAEAYSTFPNGGKKHDAHLITKIVGPTGNIIVERKKKTVKVTSKKVANQMTSMLLNVVESGTGKGTKIDGVNLAGKTGTTQLPYKDINGTKDQWFVGYTPNIVGAVWLGYDLTDREHYLSSSSSKTVVPLFKEIITQSLPYIEQEDFSTKSINEKNERKKTKEEVERTIKDSAEKFQEELPKWKEKFMDVIEEIDQFADFLIEKWGKMIND